MPSLSGYYNRGIQTDEAGAAVNSQPYWASEERIAAIGVEAARSEQFDAYVKDLGGKKPIRKVRSPPPPGPCAGAAEARRREDGADPAG